MFTTVEGALSVVLEGVFFISILLILSLINGLILSSLPVISAFNEIRPELILLSFNKAPWPNATRSPLRLSLSAVR